MSLTVKERNRYITEILNGTYSSLKAVVPINYELSKPKLVEQSIHIQFGVLIGITGDIKGKLVLDGQTSIFGSVGETMFGMPLEGEMLTSFSGELGNMIAGGLSTNVAESGINIDITSPTIVQGNTKLSGYKKALHVSVNLENVGEMGICLLLD
ncbi:chemotaxis protein CheX [Oceanobacillus halotolerans]|uniref:chemotaxis protein CheX n=1 Tax=Oceanobacillus halotolerans TaxID=2663380 RepID=UPI0013DA7365|nr:chemotaxis protein CheX [Oceanobacillus halotolerans]